jgi:hypothetical protein
MTRKIEKIVNNQIPEVWQEGVDDEVVRRERQKMIRKI